MNPKNSLRIVLILSFIGSGCSFVTYMLVAAFYPQFLRVVDILSQSAGEEYSILFEVINNMPRALFLSLGLFYGVSLLGAIWMWRLHRSGFHFYTLSQLVIVALPAVFMGPGNLHVGDLMMSALFILFYYLSLRRLGVFNNSNNDNNNTTDSQVSTD